MKTIWIVYPYGDIVGEQFMEARHIRFGRMFASNGYHVVFWTANFSHTFKKMRSDGWKTINVCKGFEIRLVPSNPYQRNISLGRARFEITFSRSLAARFATERRPDLILTAGTGLMTAFYPVWPYVAKNQVPTIYDIMDVHLFSSYMERHHKALVPFAKLLTHSIERREKPFYAHVDAICGLGKNQVQIAKKRTGRDDIPTCLVYNSIFVDGFRSKMEMPCPVSLPTKLPGEIWCVYAGSLGPSYDVEALLACAKKVTPKDKLRFIIAGAGPQGDLVAQTSRESDYITYLGSVESDWLPSIYARCDIGLCTYASYSTVDMPDKFYDYTAAGLAIVNSLAGEIKEYVEKVGVQYEAENSESLFEAIRLAAANIDTYKVASYELAERFDLGEQMKPLLKIVEQLTN